MRTGCAVDVDLLPRASQLLGLVRNQLHCPWQLHTQVEGVKVPDGVSVVSHIPPLYASLADWLHVQIKEGHVCVFLEIDNRSHALLVCYPAESWQGQKCSAKQLKPLTSRMHKCLRGLLVLISFEDHHSKACKIPGICPSTAYGWKGCWWQLHLLKLYLSRSSGVWRHDPTMRSSRMSENLMPSSCLYVRLLPILCCITSEYSSDFAVSPSTACAPEGAPMICL